jgi:hypothetical protein
MPRIRFTGRFFSARVSAGGSNTGESRCAALHLNIHLGICDIVHGGRAHRKAMSAPLATAQEQFHILGEIV